MYTPQWALNPTAPVVRRQPPSLTTRLAKAFASAILIAVIGTVLALAALVAIYVRLFPAVPSEPKAAVPIVQGQVETLRGVSDAGAVRFELTDPGTLRSKVEAAAEEDWSPDEARDDARVLVALDVLDPAVDLFSTSVEYESSSIAGYYSPKEKKLFVVSDDGVLSIEERLTLAHEITHAIQDRRFGLDRAAAQSGGAAWDSEARVAFKALVEGEASLVEDQFREQRLAPHEQAYLGWRDYRREIEGDAMIEELIAKVPWVLIMFDVFTYYDGQAFVADLYAEGGWQAVDAAFAHPPVSTEQILHPERYRRGDMPRIVTLPPLTGTLGAGWRLLDEDILGEHFITLHMADVIEPDRIAAAAEGWGGDRYAVYFNDEASESTVVFRTVWDTHADAVEFRRTYSDYLDGLFGESGAAVGTDRRCWEGGIEMWGHPPEPAYQCLWWTDDEVLALRAPSAEVGGRMFDSLSAAGK